MIIKLTATRSNAWLGCIRWIALLTGVVTRFLCFASIGAVSFSL